MATKSDIDVYSPNVWVSKSTKALFEFKDSSRDIVKGEVGKIMPVTVNGSGEQRKIMSWGTGNCLPHEREQLVASNNIIPELLGTKRDILLGGGLMCYRERTVTEADGTQKVIHDIVETPDDIRQFFEQVNIDAYLRKSANQLIVHANTFTEMVCNVGGQVVDVKAHKARHARAAEQNEDGEIEYYYINGKWHKPRDKDAIVVEVPAYNPKAEYQTKFMYHTGDDLFDDDYYYIPRWWGGKDWIVLSNRVPVFHNRNLDNGYVIRWHVEIPKDYFHDYTSDSQTPEDIKTRKTKQDEARRAFIEKINKYLSSEENAGRAVFTTYELNRSLGKDFPGIKITPLKTDMQDKALLDVFAASNDANISGQGVPPSLASIQRPGQLGSGSETRNSYLLYLAIKTPTLRKILVEPVYIMAKKNKWDPTLKFGFRDIEITKLDENKSGSQPAQVA